jgi:sugar phosphate permease
MLAQASFSAITIGLAVLAPALREEYGLSLGQVGVLLSAAWLGATVTLLPWGLTADRYGERVVLVIGLLGSAACLVGAANAGSFEALFALLVLAGAAGASVNSASGRAVMHWFRPDERGFALGIRQTAIPIGGLVVAIVLPGLAETGGSESAFLFRGRRTCRRPRPARAGQRTRSRSRVAGTDAPRPSALATVARQRPVPLRAGCGHRVRRPLPPR